jgi:hypothetical protein
MFNVFLFIFGLINFIKLIISNFIILFVYLLNKPFKLFNIKDIEFDYTEEDKKDYMELDCYCDACIAPMLIGSFFTRQLKYTTDFNDLRSD